MSAWKPAEELFEETDEARERRYTVDREHRYQAAAEIGRQERRKTIRRIAKEVADNYQLTPLERRAFLNEDWVNGELRAFEDVRTLQRHVQQIIEELRSA